MPLPSFITSPTYVSLHEAAVAMARKAQMLGVIDCVAAPTRGGLMFGVIASHQLNVPLYPIAYSSKLGAGDDKNHANALPVFGPEIKTIYLVDDIADTGYTLREIVDEYTQRGIKVITAVFHYKENDVYRPDLYHWRIPRNSPFITFPYECA